MEDDIKRTEESVWGSRNWGRFWKEQVGVWGGDLVRSVVLDFKGKYHVAGNRRQKNALGLKRENEPRKQFDSQAR